MTPSILIEIIGLTKVYKNSTEPALNDLNLTINRGEIFGLLGPNGAGKTTTISILCCQISPTRGKITIDNNDLAKNQEKIKEVIGVVPQDIAMYPSLTAYENLRFFGNMYGLKGKNLEARIEEIISVFGLQSHLHQKLSNFSGGMKRRVNLMAGLLHSPKILFLDEPTVGIDVQSKSVIIKYLEQLNRKGVSIVYTSHHMEEAEHFCTQIAIIDHGKIITQGRPKELVAKYEGCNTLEDIFLHLTGRGLRD
ncbi:MAG: ABC transporter ATP-binding protein [Bacteroidales bacterium]|nr:ABC transporter ATP-binding protein [Bacteroidales bacterium]